MDDRDLQRIAESAGERSGWDLSRVRDERDPVPWDYARVARRYLRQGDVALDIGIGGGEVFLDLAAGFGRGVGVEQVGRGNTQNINEIFGFDPASAWPEDFHDVRLRAHAFREAGCDVLAHGEYDVGYRFLDVASFVFWLKAVPMSFDPGRGRRKVREVIDRYESPRGIETNEHRELLVVRKRQPDAS